jgi:hypothetical protein
MLRLNLPIAEIRVSVIRQFFSLDVCDELKNKKRCRALDHVGFCVSMSPKFFLAADATFVFKNKITAS